MEIEVELQNLVSQDGLVVEAVDSEGLAAGLANTLERLASAAGLLDESTALPGVIALACSRDSATG